VQEKPESKKQGCLKELIFDDYFLRFPKKYEGIKQEKV
jgi:hypothetical protein